MDGHKWWGYLHTNGGVQVKRYFDNGDLVEAKKSPFVEKVCGPFMANDRDEAIKTASTQLGLYEVRNEEIEKELHRIGEEIKKGVPKGWGFTVMMFDTNTDSGSMFYISTANRDDMIKAMEEFISNNKK